MEKLMGIFDWFDGRRQSLSVLTNRSRTKQWGMYNVATIATQHDYGIFKFGRALGTGGGCRGRLEEQEKVQRGGRYRTQILC